MKAGEPLTPIEAMAAPWIIEHPHYHGVLGDPANREVSSLDKSADVGESFLHLSMHLSLAEQASIDQPRGIRAALATLAFSCASLHDAHHLAMPCLGSLLAAAQQSGRLPDGTDYVECVMRQMTRR